MRDGGIGIFHHRTCARIHTDDAASINSPNIFMTRIFTYIINIFN